MANNIEVRFRVSGNELQAHMDSVKRKSQDMANEAIKAAVQQTNAAREQLKAIEQVLRTKQQLNTLELESAKKIAAAKRDDALRKTESFYAKERQNVIQDFTQGKLSVGSKNQALSDMAKDEILDKRAIGAEYKEQLKVLKDQEKEQKLTNILAREQLENLKKISKSKGITESDQRIIDAVTKGDDKSKASVDQLLNGLDANERKRKEREEKLAKNNSFLGSLLTVDTFNKLASSTTQMAQTNNGFDAIQSTSSTAGRIVGAALGAVVGSLFGGFGTAAGAAAGSSILGEVMGGAGAIKQKQAMLTQDLIKAKNRYTAITGADPNASMNVSDMSGVGIDAISYMQLRGDYARKRGFAHDSDKTTKQAIYLEKGYGVDQSTSALIIEMQRSSRENNRDLAQLIGGVLERGKGSIFKNGDTTFLNEFMGRFAGMQKELLKSSTSVSTGLTMDILKQFNSMGGMFDARDSRSAGTISSINSALSNPSSDNTKALAYRLLSRKNPKMGIFDLDEEIQKGLGSPEYLRSMIGYVDQIGGDDQTKMKHLSGMLKGVPLAAIRTLYNNRKSLRTFDTSELRSVGLSEGALKGRAEAQTAPIERLTAETTNSVIGGQSYEAAVKAISEALGSAFGGAVIEINSKDGVIIMKGNSAIIKTNQTMKAKNEQQQRYEKVSNSRNGIYLGN